MTKLSLFQKKLTGSINQGHAATNQGGYLASRVGLPAKLLKNHKKQD
jgi:hypothetical protein